METIKVRAGLRLASFEDIFVGKKTQVNKMLFLKDNITHEFNGVYIIPELYDLPINYSSKNEQNLWKHINEYHDRELRYGILFHQFYVLSEKYNYLEYNFKLILNRAKEFDFRDGPKHIKPNVLYYNKISSTQVEGPFYMKENANFDFVIKAINEGKIYVPSKNQTFEPYKMQAAS